MIETGFSRRFGRFVGWNLGQQGWFILLSLVSTPVIYHRLGDDAFGLLSLVNVVVAQVAVLEFGFGQATIRGVARARAARDPDDEVRIVRTSVWTFGVMAVLGSAAIWSARSWLAEEWFDVPEAFVATAVATFGVSALLLWTTFFGNLANSLWQGLHRFDRVNLIMAAGSTAQVLGTVVLAVAGRPVTEIVAWTVLLGVILLGLHARLIRRELAPGALVGWPDRTAFRSMASYGSLLMVAGLFSQVHLTSGALVLGAYVSLGALPYFTIPFSIYQRAHRVAGGISSALFPLVVEMDGRGDEESLRRLFQSGTRALALGAVTIGIPALLLTGPFLTLWMGADFAEAGAPVLRRLAFAALFVLVTIPSVELSRGRGRAGRIATYVGILAAANLVGILLLAPRSGVVGAATAFAVAQVVGTAFLALATGGRHLLGCVTPRVLAFVAVAAVLWETVAPRIEDDQVALGVLAAAACALALGTAAAWTLDPEERSVLRRIAGRKG